MNIKKLRAIMCLLLVLLMLPSGLSAAAEGVAEEDMPQFGVEETAADHFTVSAEYSKTDIPTQLKAHITAEYVRGSETEQEQDAENVVISLETEQGLSIVEGGDELSEGSMRYDDKISMDVLLEYEAPKMPPPAQREAEAVPEPKLTVTVRSGHTDSTVYTCRFDGTARARAMVMGWNVGEATEPVILDSVEKMRDLFASSYYNGRPVEIGEHHYYDYPSFWELMKVVEDWNTDENDITYLHISGHGVVFPVEVTTRSWFGQKTETVLEVGQCFAAYERSAEEISKANIYYRDMLSTLKAITKGKVVIIFELCFAGQAVEQAENDELNVDRFTILTSTTGDQAQGVAETYSHFTEALYDHAMNVGGEITVNDAISRIDALLQSEELKEETNICPQSYGDTTVTLFCSDPETEIEKAQLIVVEETLDIVPDWLRMYYAYLSEEVIPEIGLADVGTQEIERGENESFWNDRNSQLSGLLSAAVCDVDGDGSMEMITAEIVPAPHDREENVCYAIDLILCEIENGCVTESDRFENAIKMLDEYRSCYSMSIDISLIEYDGMNDLYVSSGYTLVPPYQFDYAEGDYYHLHIEDGKFIKTDARAYGMNYYTKDGEVFFHRDEERTVPENAEYLARITYRRAEAEDKQEYEEEKNRHIYQAQDMTQLKEFADGTRIPECYDMIRLISREMPKSDFELLCEANHAAIEAAMGATADEYELTVSTNSVTEEIGRVYFITSPDWLKDDEEKEKVYQTYLSIIKADVLGFTEAQIKELSEFEPKRWSELMGEAAYVQCYQIDETRMIIDISIR